MYNLTNDIAKCSLITHVGVKLKLDIFTKNYARLVNVLPIKSLTHHFVKDKIITFDEEEVILQAPTQSEAAGMVLRKIGSSLKANLTISFDKLLSIMEQHGDISCLELVSDMKQGLPKEITRKLYSTIGHLTFEDTEL